MPIERPYWAICDDCLQESEPIRYSYTTKIQYAEYLQREGWLVLKTKTYCPDCREERGK